MEAVCPHTKNIENHIKKTLFSYRKMIEDVRQDEKHVPDRLGKRTTGLGWALLDLGP